jgi:hypothetical protein
MRPFFLLARGLTAAGKTVLLGQFGAYSAHRAALWVDPHDVPASPESKRARGWLAANRCEQQVGTDSVPSVSSGAAPVRARGTYNVVPGASPLPLDSFWSLCRRITLCGSGESFRGGVGAFGLAGRMMVARLRADEWDLQAGGHAVRYGP